MRAPLATYHLLLPPPTLLPRAARGSCLRVGPHGSTLHFASQCFFSFVSFFVYFHILFIYLFILIIIIFIYLFFFCTILHLHSSSLFSIYCNAFPPPATSTSLSTPSFSYLYLHTMFLLPSTLSMLPLSSPSPPSTRQSSLPNPPPFLRFPQPTLPILFPSSIS